MRKKKKDTEGFWKQFFRRYDVALSRRGSRDVEHRMSVSRFLVSMYLLALTVVVAGITVLLQF